MKELKMKSSDMKITVHRNADGVPTFRYPEEWDGETTFLNICELCCRLSEELQEERRRK